MCQKRVRFPTVLEKPLGSVNLKEDWYRKSLEKRPIDKTRQHLIESAWEAVLDEQVDQWVSGESDPERMAEVCRMFSASCTVKAIVDGLKVQEEGRKKECPKLTATIS